MPISNTTNLSAIPTPLDPSSFSVPGDMSGTKDLDLISQSKNTPSITADSVVTLKAALSVLRAARKSSQSPDKSIAVSSQMQIIYTVSYLVGFLESKGLLYAEQARSGFNIINRDPYISSTKPNPLDIIDEYILKIISSSDTRGPLLGSIVASFGAYLTKDGFGDMIKAFDE